MTTYIYHERQESQLCGQHCLNNVLQEPFFSSEELGLIAQELDEMERSYLTNTDDLMRVYQAGSYNVDETGNFSVQVLKVALERFHNIELLSWNGEEGRSLVNDVTQETAIIVNLLSHWYTIRKIGDKWWNLDSLKPKPELISHFYLSAYIAQLRAEGWTVFVARGNIASNKQPPSNIASFPDNCTWHSETSLINSSDITNQSKPRNEEAKPFSGAGKRLGSTAGVPYETKDFEISPDDDDDTILAKALSASAAEAAANETKKVLTPAEMREKRLEAFRNK